MRLTADFEHLGASLLSSSASAYAGLAASQLLNRHPGVAEHFAPGALSAWKTHLTARTQELAVAVEFEAPQVMNASVAWSRASFEAQQVPSEDLRASLECLRDVLAEELPEHTRQRPIEYVEGALELMDQQLSKDDALKPTSPNDQLALAYIEACLSGNPRRAKQLILDAAKTGTLHTVYFDVLARAQQEVGRLWHAGKIGIHEEHFVTATTLSLLVLLSHQASMASEIGKTVVGAAIGGEGHELGVRMIMDFFSMAGWNSVCLGSSVPGYDIEKAVQDFEGDLLVLSVTLVTNLRFLRSTIESVRDNVPETKILVGGQAFQFAPNVWQRVGADGIAMGADEAVATAAQLLDIQES
jgi:methanogenic corrinoid protein MtbC1